MRRLIARLSVIAAVSALPAAVFAQQAASAVDLDGFDEWVSAVMHEWHVPGLALGVIQDGQPVVLKGYGFRDVERQLPVTAATLMAIGSNSKSFTVVLLGMLADSSKLEWDEPVRTYLHDFRLFDDFATQEMTPRDLVTHRSGLPRHDALWYGRSFTREELYQRLRHLEPSASFRSRWQYQNLMFMTAGHLAERVTGESWDRLIRDRIFDPLGMVRSNTSVADLVDGGDVALAYVWRDCPADRATARASAAPSAACGLTKVPYRNIDAVGPAGSINSSVEEMLHYIQFHIDSGAYGGHQLLSKQSAAAMQTPQALVGGPETWPDELGTATYGLGLGVSTYRGHKLVQHGGGIDGFISQMSWLPRERIGIMVLTNMSGNNPVPTLVTRNLIDRLLGLDPVDWVDRTRTQQAENEVRQAKRRAERAAERKPGTSPSHPLSAYAGSYEHPGYGRFTVETDGKALVLSWDGFRIQLEHFHFDVFESPERPGVPFNGRVTFLMNAKGDVDRMAVPLESNVADIVFTRTAS